MNCVEAKVSKGDAGTAGAADDDKKRKSGTNLGGVTFVEDKRLRPPSRIRTMTGRIGAKPRCPYADPTVGQLTPTVCYALRPPKPSWQAPWGGRSPQ